MAWYMVAAAAGILMPVLLAPATIFRMFREGGASAALGYWSGMLWITIPLMYAIMLLVHLVVR